MFTIRRGSHWYTGSDRLYNIQCYVERHRDLLEEYLDQPHTAPLPTTLNYSLVRQAVNHLRYQYQELYFTWNPQVVFLYCLQLLQGVDAKVSDLLQQAFADHETFPELEELLYFTRQVETQEDALDYFEVEFFSVMKQDLQFFSAYPIAQRYGSKIYEYTPDYDLDLPNISDPEVSQRLASEVFSSQEPYTSDEVSYYAEGSRETIRYGILTDFFDRWVDSGISGYYFFAAHYQPLPNALQEVLGTNGRTPFDLEWIGAHWLELFRVELLSPYGLWTLSQKNIMGTRLWTSSTQRITMYNTDALLSYTLRNNSNYHGWFCELPYEIMIFNPSRYGRMRPLQAEFDRSCEFIV